MKILVIGEVFAPNLGDPIINESVSYLISEKYKNSEIIYLDLSTREEYPNPTQNNNKISKTKRIIAGMIIKFSSSLTKIGIDTEYYRFKRKSSKSKEYFEDFFVNNNFDLAVFAGGQMFFETFLFAIQNILKELNDKNIPVIFNSIGYGRIQSPRMKKMLRRNLMRDNIISISTRDDIESIKTLLVDTDVKVEVTDDAGLWAADVYKTVKEKSDVVGLGIMYVRHIEYNALINFWIKTIEELDKNNRKWKLFCNGSFYDYKLLLDLLTKLNYSDEYKEKLYYSRPDRPKDLVKDIASFNSIISFRLHSHIVAYSLNIPSIGIVWDPKVEYFFDSLGMEDKYFNIDTNISKMLSLLDDDIDSNQVDLLLQKKYDCKKALYKNIDMGI